MNDLTNLCRCCLTTDGEMKNMQNETYQISSIEEDEQLMMDSSIHNTEVFIGINLLEALSMIGINSDNTVAAYQQICSRCESGLKFCLEFHQQCIKSIQTLKNIKEEGLEDISVHYEDDLFDQPADVIIVEGKSNALDEIDYNSIKTEIKYEGVDDNTSVILPRKRKRKNQEQSDAQSQFSQVLIVDEDNAEQDTKKRNKTTGEPFPKRKANTVRPLKKAGQKHILDTANHDHISDADIICKFDDSDIEDNYFQINSFSKTVELGDDTDRLNKKSITSAEANLEAEYMCYHCDRIFSTYIKYVNHRETHKKSKGYSSIKRVCNLCENPVEGYIQHLVDHHKKYRPNKCSLCKYSSNNQYSLVQHMVKHLTVKAFQCRACNEMYNHPKTLSQHVRTHFDIERYFCPICGFFKSKISDLLRHKAHEHPDDDQKWYPCSKCKRIYFKFATHESHKCTAPNLQDVIEDEIGGEGQIIIESAGSGLPKVQCDICKASFQRGETFDCHHLICENHQDYFNCMKCNIQFSNRRTLRKHHETKHSTKEFICEFCSRRFSLKVYLQAHLYSHTDVRTEQCPICMKFFKSKLQLSLHKQIHREKEFECAKCGKKFVKKDSLKGHLRKHFKVLCREKCHICQKVFGGITPLRIHMRVHTGEKPFECAECNKFYYTKHALKTHNDKIHKNKRYDCKYCDKSFAAVKSIHEHAFMHKGYSPFNCPVCFKKFSRKDAFKKHLQEHRITYDEEMHGFTGESFHDVVMSVLKNPEHEESIEYVTSTLPNQMFDENLQIISEEIVEEEIIEFDDDCKAEIEIVDHSEDHDVVFENYLITHI